MGVGFAAESTITDFSSISGQGYGIEQNGCLQNANSWVDTIMIVVLADSRGEC